MGRWAGRVRGKVGLRENEPSVIDGVRDNLLGRHCVLGEDDLALGRWELAIVQSGDSAGSWNHYLKTMLGLPVELIYPISLYTQFLRARTTQSPCSVSRDMTLIGLQRSAKPELGAMPETG